MTLSGSGKPEVIDFKEPYRIPACRQAGPIKPFGNDGFGFFNVLLRGKLRAFS
jgi:hypothetical protein